MKTRINIFLFCTIAACGCGGNSVADKKSPAEIEAIQKSAEARASEMAQQMKNYNPRKQHAAARGGPPK